MGKNKITRKELRELKRKQREGMPNHNTKQSKSKRIRPSRRGAMRNHFNDESGLPYIAEVDEMAEREKKEVAPKPAQSVSSSAEFKKTSTSPRSGKEQLNLKTITPRNFNQAIAMEAASDPACRFTFAEGPAGSSKTFSGMWAALNAYNKGEVDKIVIIVPLTVTSNKELGYYTGSQAEKLKNYATVVDSTLEKLVDLNVTTHQTSYLDRLTRNFPIEVRSTNHERGMTYDRTFVVVDEAHNLQPHEMRMLVTRMGEGGRYFITGDVSMDQNDGDQLTEPGFTNLLLKLTSKAVVDTQSDFKDKIAVIKYTEGDSAARDPDLPLFLDALTGEAERALGIEEYVPPLKLTEDEKISVKKRDVRKDKLQEELLPACAAMTEQRYTEAVLNKWLDLFPEKLEELEGQAGNKVASIISLDPAV